MQQPSESSFPTLETPRLLLRMFRESDLDAYAQMCGDPEVMRYLNDGEPLSREDAWRHMAMVVGHWSLRGFGLWAVELKETGAMIGRIGCYRPEGWPELEVGWALRRHYWGRGYATEGARASLRFAFTQLKADHVVSIIHPLNTASIALAKSLGESLERESIVSATKVVIYGISRHAWERISAETDLN